MAPLKTSLFSVNSPIYSIVCQFTLWARVSSFMSGNIRDLGLEILGVNPGPETNSITYTCHGKVDCHVGGDGMNE